MNGKTVRKVIIWTILIVVCIPGILLGELPAKLFCAALLGLLIWWDNRATTKSSKFSSNTKPSTVVKPKIDKYAALEQKAVWRLLKVFYAIFAGIMFIWFVNGSLIRIDECKSEHVVHGTRMLQAAMQRSIDNGTVCNVSNTQIAEVLLAVVVLLSLYAGFLLFRDIVRYIVFGKSPKSALE